MHSKEKIQKKKDHRCRHNRCHRHHSLCHGLCQCHGHGCGGYGYVGDMF